MKYHSRFFFQTEDCIRYGHVTGVQTCALPILLNGPQGRPIAPDGPVTWETSVTSTSNSSSRSKFSGDSTVPCLTRSRTSSRSEERREGKEHRYREEQQQ